MFSKDNVITLTNGQKVKVIKLLGQGGQGAVYEVESEGVYYALKWYLPEYLKQINQKKFYENLKENHAAGAPSSSFLWPLAISGYKKDAFGYLMDLRDGRYSGFSSILNARKRFTNLSTLLTTAKNICEAFQILHRKGYSYQDINDGSFFIDTTNGDVLICDNDNIAPYGTWLGIIGKDRYMAPEVVLGQKKPSMETDLYSLSVILFMLFFIAHPLEGEAVHACPCLTAKFVRKLYAEKAVFVYDPNNTTNRPVKGIDNNVITLWQYYPEKLKDLFTRAFTDGLYKASYRVRENEWIECFEYLLDSLAICPHCGNEDFYFKEKSADTFLICEDCGKKYAKPYVLNGKHIRKVLNLRETIYGRQIGQTGYDIVATVVESSKHKGLIGLKNLSDLEFFAKIPNGKEVVAGTGQVVPLFDETQIRINEQEINITF